MVVIGGRMCCLLYILGYVSLASPSSYTPFHFIFLFYNCFSFSEILFSLIYVLGVFFDQFGSLLSVRGCYREVDGDRTRPYQVVGFGGYFFQVIYQVKS